MHATIVYPMSNLPSMYSAGLALVLFLGMHSGVMLMGKMFRNVASVVAILCFGFKWNVMLMMEVCLPLSGDYIKSCFIKK